MSKEITKELNGRILTITISRPQKKNALTLDMYSEFAKYTEDGKNLEKLFHCHAKPNSIDGFLEDYYQF